VTDAGGHLPSAASVGATDARNEQSPVYKDRLAGGRFRPVLGRGEDRAGSGREYCIACRCKGVRLLAVWQCP
jgi:hypothetical protein